MSPHQPRSVRRLLVALFAVSAVLLTACGDDGASAANSGQAGAPSTTAAAGADTGDPADGPVAVDISDFSYAPATITVSPGQQVTFTNDDKTAHTATAKDGSFNTDAIQPGEDASVTAPDQPGEYPFICSFHPFMKGTVVVQ